MTIEIGYPKGPEDKKESKPFSISFIEQEIRQLLGPIGVIKKINNVKMSGEGDKIELFVDFEAKVEKTLKGVVTIVLENINGTVDLANYSVEGSFVDKSTTFQNKAISSLKALLKPQLSKISETIKSYIEKEEGKMIKGIEIVNGQLNASFLAPLDEKPPTETTLLPATQPGSQLVPLPKGEIITQETRIIPQEKLSPALATPTTLEVVSEPQEKRQEKNVTPFKPAITIPPPTPTPLEIEPEKGSKAKDLLKKTKIFTPEGTVTQFRDSKGVVRGVEFPDGGTVGYSDNIGKEEEIYYHDAYGDKKPVPEAPRKKYADPIKPDPKLKPLMDNLVSALENPTPKIEEKKEQKESKSFPVSFIEQKIRELLDSEEAIKKINNVKVEGSGEKITLSIDFEAQAAGKTIKGIVAGILSNKDGTIGLENYSVEGGFFDKALIKTFLGSKMEKISDIIRSYIEKEEKKQVKSIQIIENVGLKVTFNVPEGTTIPKPVTKTETIPKTETRVSPPTLNAEETRKKINQEKRKWGPLPLSPFMALGVLPSATKEEVQEAYIKMAWKYQPDLNPDNKQEAEEWMKIINEARNILLDPTFIPSHFKTYKSEDNMLRLKNQEERFTPVKPRESELPLTPPITPNLVLPRRPKEQTPPPTPPSIPQAPQAEKRESWVRKSWKHMLAGAALLAGGFYLGKDKEEEPPKQQPPAVSPATNTEVEQLKARLAYDLELAKAKMAHELALKKKETPEVTNVQNNIRNITNPSEDKEAEIEAKLRDGKPLTADEALQHNIRIQTPPTVDDISKIKKNYPASVNMGGTIIQ